MAITWNDVHADITLTESNRTAQNDSGDFGFRSGLASEALASKVVFGFYFPEGMSPARIGAFNASVFDPSTYTGPGEIGNDPNCWGVNSTEVYNGTAYVGDTPFFVGFNGYAVLFAYEHSTGKVWVGYWDTTTLAWDGDPGAGTGETFTITGTGPFIPGFTLYDYAGGEGGGKVTGLFTAAQIAAAFGTSYSHPSGFGDFDTSGGGGPIGTGTVTLNLQQRVLDMFGYGQSTIALEQQVYQYGRSQLNFQQVVSLPSGRAEVALQQAVVDYGSVSLSLNQQVADYSLFSSLPSTMRWTMSVRRNGVDITANLFGQATITQRETSARVAEFSVYHPAAVFDPMDYVGASVTIDWILSSGPTTYGTWRRFTGVVNDVDYNPNTGTLDFTCGDKLQERIDKMTKAQVDAFVVNGKWSNSVFGDNKTRWEYLQDLLSTTPKSLDIDNSGTIRVTSWLAKSSPDFTFNANQVIDNSVSVESASRSELVNEVVINAEHRMERRYQRTRRVSWRYKRDFIQYLIRSTTLPNKQMCRDSVNRLNGWLVGSISFTYLPPSGVYDVDGTPTIWLGRGLAGEDAGDSRIVTGFNATLRRRWTQTVTEKYKLTLRAPESIARPGGVSTVEIGSNHESEYKIEDWEGINGVTETSTLNTRADRTTPDGSSVGPRFEPPAGFTQLPSGDYYKDEKETSNVTTMLETLLAQGVTRLLESARGTTVSFEVPINPVIETYHTVRLNSPRCTAKGKVRGWEDLVDISTGRATTTVHLAIFQGGTGATSLPAVPAVPSVPVYDPGDPADNPDDLTLSTSNDQYGGLLTSGDYNEEREGYSGNYSPPDAGATLFPVRLLLSLAEPETAARDPQEITRDLQFNVTVPDDLLTIS